RSSDLDDEERPKHERKRAERGGRIRRFFADAENSLEGVERAGPDIAEYDAKRRQAQHRQLALPGRPHGIAGRGCRIFAQCTVQCGSRLIGEPLRVFCSGIGIGYPSPSYKLLRRIATPERPQAVPRIVAGWAALP